VMRSGTTEIVPSIETAAGLVTTHAIARAAKRVTACLLGAEDMAADLGVERTPEGVELEYVRSRFFVECVAVGVVAIDVPYTFSDEVGARSDTQHGRRLGYQAKSGVSPAHVSSVNEGLTPGHEAVERAQRLVTAFEAARAAGRDRLRHAGAPVAMPTQ